MSEQLKMARKFELGDKTNDEIHEIAIQTVKIGDAVDVPVAYFARDGSVQCEECIGIHRTEPNPLWDGITPTKIFVENLSPYSQTCHVCSKLVYKGTVPNILFENKNEPIPVIDVHDENAKISFGVEQPTDEQRAIAQNANFGALYGMPVPTDEPDEPYEPVTQWDRVYGEQIICDAGVFKGMFDFVPDFFSRRHRDAVANSMNTDMSMNWFIPVFPSDREKYPHSTRLKNPDTKYIKIVSHSTEANTFPAHAEAVLVLPEDANPLHDTEGKRFDPHGCDVCSALTNAGYDVAFVKAYHNSEPMALQTADADPAIRSIIDTIDTYDEDENT